MKVRTKKILLSTAIFLVVCFVPILLSGRIDSRMAATVETVKNGLLPLDLEQLRPYSEDTREYFKYYGLDVENAAHYFGSFVSGKNTMAAHVFKVPESKATVLIAHGYYDHAGVWKHVIAHLTKRGFTVAVYDQPGHGLSSGERASIDDFSEYVTVLEDFLAVCRTNLPGPYYLAAHSTGCSATIDHLSNVKDTPLEKIVLIAPLVRSVAWKISGFGQTMGGKVLDYVPRTFRRNSSNGRFLRFMKQDPLQARRVPMNWIAAHRKWVKKMEAMEPVKKKVKIIQGTSDTTVDWQHNIGVLKDKFPAADVSFIKGGGHQLINESPGMRQETLELISGWFTE